MPVQLGTTLRCNLPPRHIWIVLTDPERMGGNILLVNLTSLTEGCIDDACILEPADFDLLTHETTVAYSRSIVGTAEKLEDLIQNGHFTDVAPVPPATLQRILEGARITRALSADKKLLIG
jgi:hypothetical protein